MAAVFIEHSAGRIGAMQTAVDSGDLPNVVVGAHTLKGSARQLGLTDMADACLAVELAGREGDAAAARARTAAVHEAYTAAVEWLRAETA